MTVTARPLLVVDDDAGIQRQLRWSFERYRTTVAGDRQAALDVVRREKPPVVTLDLGLPPRAEGPEEGLATLQEILSINPRTKVVVVTGNDGRDTAVRAIGLGAYDFCPKPIDGDLLGLIVDRAFSLCDLEDENRRLQGLRGSQPLDGLITTSAPMQRVCRMVEKAAPAEVSVLLLGESGTGKELLARALHQMSLREGKPFVAINCGAIPENLLESELFGFEKGAFTGAVKQTPGRVELANGGTLFLDEIGDLPRSLQVKLLRFLQERVIERVGGRKSLSVDVRVICATHQDLGAAIERGDFREDLYYRVSELVIEIPPLREREEDAVVIAQSILTRHASVQKRNLKGFTAGAIAAINAHRWPGNVRELENRIKRAVILTDGPQVTAADLDLGDEQASPVPLTLREIRALAESKAVQQALALSDGNVSQAAKILDVSRPTLYDLMRQFGFREHDAASSLVK